MTNLEKLNIVVFWNIVENGDTTQLDINKNTKYSKEQLEELDKHWSKLYDDFYEHRKNKSGRYLVNKNFELAKLSLMLQLLADIENRIIILINIDDIAELKRFKIVRTVEVIKDFRKLYPKVRISNFDNLLEVLTIVQSVIKSQMNIYDEKVGVKEKTIQKQKETIYEIVAIMSKILGYNLNINSMSCMEFLGHENLINSTNKK